MNFQILYIITSFILSVGCGFVFIPIITNFCRRKGLYDLPDERKVHKIAIPRLGGLSFLPSMFLASVIVILLFDQQFSGRQITVSSWSVAFFISLLIIYSVGLTDDFVGLDAKTKFIAQIVSASILMLSGLYINNLYGFLGLHEIPFYIGAPLTVFVIVFISNAINLIDGIDGLSGGLALIALTGFEVCFMREEGMLSYCILIAGLMGVLVPFLYFNLFGTATKGNKVFMGDSGSLTLGFIMGFLFVKLTMYNPDAVAFHIDSMMLAYSLLIVPVYDVVRVSFIRFAHHTPIFQADKNHIHHKLMRAGLSQHQTLIVILLFAVLYIAINIPLWHVTDMSIVVAIDIAVWMTFHWYLNKTIVSKGNQIFLK